MHRSGLYELSMSPQLCNFSLRHARAGENNCQVTGMRSHETWENSLSTLQSSILLELTLGCRYWSTYRPSLLLVLLGERNELWDTWLVPTSLVWGPFKWAEQVHSWETWSVLGGFVNFNYEEGARISHPALQPLSGSGSSQACEGQGGERNEFSQFWVLIPNQCSCYKRRWTAVDARQPRSNLPVLVVAEPLMLPLQVCVHVWPSPSVNDLHVLNLVKAAMYQNPTAPALPSLLLVSFFFFFYISLSLQSLYNWYY